MTLNKFLLLLLGVYGAYYCFLILMDFVRSKTTSKTSMSTEAVHYEVEVSQPPIDVRQLTGRENPEETTWDEASGGGEKKKITSPEQTAETTGPATDSEEGYKNLGVDLGLEPASFQGVEVTTHNIKRLLNP